MALLGILNHLESQAGRCRDPQDPKGPRVLDLDLVYAGEYCCRSPRLVVPHERMHLRRFVLEPLLEIMGDAMHPVTGQRLSVHLAGCAGQGIYSAARLV